MAVAISFFYILGIASAAIVVIGLIIADAVVIQIEDRDHAEGRDHAPPVPPIPP